MTLTTQIIRNIVTRVIKSEDYRIEIINIINAEFLQFAIDFFKKIVDAKIKSDEINIEWYRKTFINNKNLSPDDIVIFSGLNKKTISNMYGTAKKEVILDASNEHFDKLYNSIENLTENEMDVDLLLTIKFKQVSVELNISESLIVINTLAVKRAALRGGMWSTAGKSAEKYLMLTLCKLYKVEPQYYNAEHFVKNKNLAVDREIDFYLKNDMGKEFKCEVKLMGKGNPESADAIYARKTDLFVADTLSEQNKNQCDELGVCWVACREENGYKRFCLALEKFEIPYTDYNGDLDVDLPRILDTLL
ncbi:MAG: CfrBI family restriction endonuclease [Prevotella sp.]|nr:CfrBI family restriction endonuclease [Prevotella sp.]